MKIIITAFLAFLAFLLVGTISAGQRLTDIQPGLPCDGIAGVEKGLGSVELAAEDATGIRKYRGTEEGLEATVIYHCEQGQLSEQEIIFTGTSQDAAYQIANQQRQRLATTLGEPVHDGLNMGVLRRMYFGFLGADLDYLTSVVVWGKKKEDVMLVITQPEENRWEVTISQGSSKIDYILN